MKQFLHIPAALLALTLMPGAAAAQRVNYDFHKNADFSAVRSFEMKDAKLSENPLLNQRIIESIAGTLTARGMIRKSDPDVYVVPSLKTETRKEVTSYSPWYGPYADYGWYGSYRWDWWGPGTVEVRNLQYDTLTIDIVDARSGNLLWRGEGTRHVHHDWKPETIDRKVNKTVGKILDNFPPTADD